MKLHRSLFLLVCTLLIAVCAVCGSAAVRSLTNLASGLGGAVGMCLDPSDRNYAYFVEFNTGNLRRINLTTGGVTTVAAGLTRPEDVAISGRTAYVTEQVGRLTAINLVTGEKSTIVSGLSSPHQLVVRTSALRVGSAPEAPSAGGVVLTGLAVTPRIERAPAAVARPPLRLVSQAYLVEYDAGNLTRVDLIARTKSVVKSGLGHPVGLAVDGNIAYVTEQDGNRITRIDLSTGTSNTVVSGLSGPFFLYRRANRQGLFVTERGARRLSYVDTSLSTPVAKEVVPGLADRPAGILVSRDETACYIATDASIQKATLRSCYVEMDCMTGTAFPPNGLSHAGEIATLEGMYLEAAMMIDARQDEANVANVPGGNNYFTCAELDSLMAAHRNPAFAASGEKWSAYYIVVDGYFQYDDGTQDTTVLGVMYDTADRDGCAVFHDHSYISTMPKAFLRTTAHELGHVFNLLHSFSDGHSTIMAKTGWISPFPDAISYHFSDVSKRHLREHATENVRPGGIPFATCPESH